MYVLCIFWAKNDIHPEDEIRRLRECFEILYKYKVATLALPDDHTADSRLQKEIVDLVDRCCMKERSLLVIYYAGHCGPNAKDQSAVWSA